MISGICRRDAAWGFLVLGRYRYFAPAALGRRGGAKGFTAAVIDRRYSLLNSRQSWECAHSAHATSIIQAIA
jgi:hypothetical protein